MTYRNDDVVALTANLVNVKVNAEKDSLISRKYGVAGFPTIVLAKSDGSEIDRIYGYADGPEFVTTINDYLADRNTLADYIRRAEAAPTMQLYSQIAEKYTGRSKFEEAGGYYEKILSSDPENKQGYSDSALLWLAQMKSRAKKYTEAEETLLRLPKMFPSSKLVDKAAFEIANTHRYAKEFDKAIASYQDFLKIHPESDLASDAEIYIAYCHDKKGDKDGAIRLYKQFLTNHPNSSDTAWVKKQIDKILNPPPEEGKSK